MASEPYSTMSANNGINHVCRPNLPSLGAAIDSAREASRATGKSVSVHDSRGREIVNFHSGRESGRRSSL